MSNNKKKDFKQDVMDNLQSIIFSPASKDNRLGMIHVLNAFGVPIDSRSVFAQDIPSLSKLGDLYQKYDPKASWTQSPECSDHLNGAISDEQNVAIDEESRDGSALAALASNMNDLINGDEEAEVPIEVRDDQELFDVLPSAMIPLGELFQVAENRRHDLDKSVLFNEMVSKGIPHFNYF
jgi:hypothetical protein